MAKKLYDLAVKTGTYQKNGETKGRYQNVGAVMQGDDGGKFIFLSAWFNPAGVDRRDGSESILLSMFEPRDPNQSGQTDHGRAKADGYAPAPQRGSPPPMDDDAPF